MSWIKIMIVVIIFLIPTTIYETTINWSEVETMSINKDQLRKSIADILKGATLYSADTVELLMLTAAVETNLGEYIYQTNGPACGIFQMEPATANDMDINYLAYKPSLAKIVELHDAPISLPENLKYNLAASVVRAALHYERMGKQIPSKNDVVAMANFWKKHWNTSKGKGTVEKAIEKYKMYCV